MNRRIDGKEIKKHLKVINKNIVRSKGMYNGEMKTHV